MIGSLAVAKFPSINGSESLVTFGLYFVHPNNRKMGLGSELFRMAMTDSHFSGMNRGLIAVEMMIAKYRDSHGFIKIPTSKAITARALVSDLQLSNLAINEKIQVLNLDVALRTLDFGDIVKFDMENNGGVNREKYLNAWLTAPNTLSAKIAIDQNEKVIGIITIRTSMEKLNIGVSPLIAKSPEIAATLLRRALESIKNLDNYNQIFFFPLSDNQVARKVYVKLTVGTIIPVVTCQPMYTLKTLPIKVENVFSMTEYAMCTV